MALWTSRRRFTLLKDTRRSGDDESIVVDEPTANVSIILRNRNKPREFSASSFCAVNDPAHILSWHT